MSEQMKPLGTVLRELTGLAQQRYSGVLNIATNEGRFASIRLRGGRIEEVSYKAKYNDDAIRLLALATQGRARFEQVRLTPGIGRHAILSEALLRWMLSGFVGAAPEVTHTPMPPRTNGAVPLGVRLAHRAAVQQVALTFLGPFASLACEEAFADGNDIDSALQRIASNLIEDAEAERFVAEARAALIKLG